MAFDAHSNLVVTTVATAPAPATTGLSLTVAAGQGAIFPAAPFNCTVWPGANFTVPPLLTNAEIVRVTAVVGDVLTIVRGQEGTTAKAISTDWQIALSVTAKSLQDIEAFLPVILSANGVTAQGPTFEFSNANDVTFGIAGNVITASFSNTGVATGGILSIFADGGDATGPQVVFSNANGVSFGNNVNTITASFDASNTGVIFSAGTTSQSLTKLIFEDGNNVSFGLDNGTLTASVFQEPQVPFAISADGGSQSTGTVLFTNTTNSPYNVVFGYNAETITAVAMPMNFDAAGGGITINDLGDTLQFSVAAQSSQPVAASAANGSFLFSTLGFSNSNNVSFSTSAGSIIVASATVASTQGSIRLSAGTTSNLGSNFVFSNSNNVSFSMNGSTITASAHIFVAAGTTSNSLSALTFGDIGGVAFGMNGSQITASVASSLTNIRISAGTTTNLLSAFTLSNSNNVSFGLNAGVVTATATVASTQGSIVMSAGTTSNTGSQFVFSNSNNVSFGLNGSTITATATVTQSNQNITAGNGGFAFQTLSFSNANNVSFSTSAGSAIVASATVASTQGSLVISAGTTSTTGSQFVFSNSNNVSFGLNGSTITASATVATSLSNIRVSAGTTSNLLSAITFGNGGGVSFGLDAGTITANVTAAAAPVNFSAGTTSGNLGSVVFSNLNGVTFGLNGSTITASVGGGAESNNINLLGANTAGNTTASGSTLGFSGLNLTLSGTNNSQIVFSVPATSSLIGTGGVSLSTAGSTISVSLVPIYQFEANPPMATGSTTYVQPIGQWWFQPFNPPFPISGGRLNLMTQFGSTSQLPLATTSASFGTGTTGSKNLRYQYSLSAALFSLGAGTNSTRLESFWSNQCSFEISHLVSISQAAGASMTVSQGVTLSAIQNINSLGSATTTTFGGSSTVATTSAAMNSTANSSILSSVNNMLSNSLQLPVPFNTTVNPGQYFLGVAWSTASTTGGSSQVGFTVVNGVGQLLQTNVTGYRMIGLTAANASSAHYPGRGIYSASTAAPPTTIAFTDIRTLATNAMNYVNWVNSNAITV